MILGANPEELDQLAARISQRAEAYEHAHQQITYWLNRLSWQGPDAHRFRAAYRSSMGPQLVDAASALRDAASSLRSQAAQQRTTSAGQSGVRPTGASLAALLGVGSLGAGAGAGLLHTAKSWFEFHKTLFEFNSKSLDLFEIGDFARVAVGAQKVDKPFGAARLFGKSASKSLGVIGAVYSGLTFWGELGEMADDIGDFDWNDQDSIEQFFYSGTDLMISAGSVLGATPLAPAGLVLMSTGYVMKAGTAILPYWVNRAVDDKIWPLWDILGRRAWDSASRNFQDGAELFAAGLYDAQKFATNDIPELVGDVVGGVGDFAGDVAEGTLNVVRDMGQSSRLMVENLVDNVASGVRGLLRF